MRDKQEMTRKMFDVVAQLMIRHTLRPQPEPAKRMSEELKRRFNRPAQVLLDESPNKRLKARILFFANCAPSSEGLVKIRMKAHLTEGLAQVEGVVDGGSDAYYSSLSTYNMSYFQRD